MTAPTVKPGTRCECDGSCQNKPHTFECGDAVRLVTVYEPLDNSDVSIQVGRLMCAACANYAERVK